MGRIIAADKPILRGDDTATYYCRQLDDRRKLYWVGEHDGFEFVNVFEGDLHYGDDPPSSDYTLQSDHWTGEYWDVPRGRICVSGSPLHVIATFVNTGMDVAPRLSREPGPPFRGTEWFLGVSYSEPRDWLVANRFEHRDDATGMHLGTDGGLYYVTHDPGRALVWYGVAKAPSPERRPPWATVFVGRPAGPSVYRGAAVDVPKGDRDFVGDLTVEAGDLNVLRVTHATGGFPTVELHKVQSFDVMVVLTDVTVVTAEDAGGDEPVLHVLWAKVDGTTVDLSDPARSDAELFWWRSPELADDLASGRIGLPAFGTSAREPQGWFRATVTSIPASYPRTAPGFDAWVGVAVTAWDSDSSSEEVRTLTFDSWVRAATHAIRTSAQQGTLPNGLAGQALVRETLRDDDDWLGNRERIFTLGDIRAATGSRQPFVFDFAREGGHYQVHGYLEVRPRLNPACTR